MKHLKEVLPDYTKEEIIGMFINLCEMKGIDPAKVEVDNPCCPKGSCGVCVDGVCIFCK